MSALGNLVVSVALESAAFTKGIDKTSFEAQRFAQNLEKSVNRGIKSFGDGAKEMALKAAGIIGVATTAQAAITRLFDTFNRMDELAKVSQKIGIPIEQLSALDFAAKMSGVQLEQLADSFKDFNKNLTEAARGSEEKAAMFKVLGISVTDAFGQVRQSQDVFVELADQFKNFPDGPEKSAAAMKLFGESGLRLIPLLNAGSEGISELMEEAKRLGVVLDTDAAKAAESFNDNVTRLAATSDALYVNLANQLAPSLTDLTERMLDATKVADSFGSSLSVMLDDLFTLGDGADKLENIGKRLDVFKGVQKSEETIATQAQFTLLQLKKQNDAAIKAFGGFEILNSALNQNVKSTAELAAEEKSYLDLLAQSGEARKKAEEAAKAGAAAAKKAALEQAQLKKQIKALFDTEKDRAALLAKQALLGRELTDAEKELVKIEREYGAEIAAKIKPLMESNDLQEAQLQINKEFKKLRADIVGDINRETKSLEDQNKTIQGEIDRIGLKGAALDELEAQYLDTAAAALEYRESQLGFDEFDQIEALTLKSEQLREQARLLRLRSQKQIAEDMVEQNRRAAKQIENDLVNAFEDAFVRGGSFAESFRRAIQAEFSKLVLRPVIQAALGTGQAADGSGVNPLGLASNLAGISSGLGSIFGASGAFTSFAAASNTFANAAVFGASQLSTLAGASAATTGTLTSLAASAGAAIPYIAAAVAAYKGLEAVGVISKGETRAGGTYTLQGGVFNRTQGPSGGEFGGDEVRRAALETVNLINNTLKSLGSDSYITGFEAGLETSTKGRGGVFAGGQLSSGMGFGESLGRAGGFEQWTPQSLGAEDAFKLFAQDLMQSYLQALQVESDKFAGNVQDYIRGLGEIELLSDSQLQTAALVVQQLDYVNKNFSQMSNGLDRLSGASVEAIQNFFNAVGGFEGLNAGMAAFNQTFLTDSERFELLTQKAVQALQAVGISTDGLLDAQGKFVADARTQLRTLADGLDKTTAAGAQTFAGLLGLSGALGEVLPQLQDATQALEEVGRSAADIAQERLGLENRLLTLQGNTNELRRRELEALDSTNRSILEQIFAFEDARAAEEKLQSVRDANQRLQEQALETQRQALQRIAGLGKSIADYVRGLSISEPTLTPQQRLQGASSEFNRLLSMAQGGDESALQQITGVSDQFLNAARDFYGSSEAFQSILANVKGGLLGLPAVETYEQQVLGLLGELNSGFEAFNLSLTEGINSVIASLVTGFDSIDLDVSGTLSFAELQAALAGKATDAQIQTLIGVTDQNNDQLISKFEFELTRLFSESQNVRNAVFNGFTTLDTTANGLLDFNELRSGLSGLANDSTLQTIFRELDMNGDGVISRIEATNARLDGLAGAIRANLAPLFDSIDSNVSGGISKTEFEQAFGSFGLGPRLDQIFQEIDINGNGTIDRLEAGNTLQQGNNTLTQGSNDILNLTTTMTREIQNMAIRSAGSGLFVRPPSGGDPFNFNLNDIRGGIGNWIKVQSLNQAGTNAVRFRDGGLVTGPGTGTSDSIPAWLSNREFVMNAGAVSKFGSSFMEQINQGMMPVMPVPMGMQGQQVNISMDAVVRELRDLKKVVAALDLNVSVTVPVDGKKIRQDVFKQLKDDSRNGIPVVYSAGVVA